MHFSTRLVLFAAAVTGVFHTAVTASAIPYTLHSRSSLAMRGVGGENIFDVPILRHGQPHGDPLRTNPPPRPASAPALGNQQPPPRTDPSLKLEIPGIEIIPPSREPTPAPVQPVSTTSSHGKGGLRA
ncbi:hypothetical protein BC835DRAFT_1413635 [Cytidiella melzeri]|nr:hypothetical protein BC835DRAFT_1413635 [Cytidiella melzeri]